MRCCSNCSCLYNNSLQFPGAAILRGILYIAVGVEFSEYRFNNSHKSLGLSLLLLLKFNSVNTFELLRPCTGEQLIIILKRYCRVAMVSRLYIYLGNK